MRTQYKVKTYSSLFTAQTEALRLSYKTGMVYNVYQNRESGHYRLISERSDENRKRDGVHIRAVEAFVSNTLAFGWRKCMADPTESVSFSKEDVRESGLFPRYKGGLR